MLHLWTDTSYVPRNEDHKPTSGLINDDKQIQEELAPLCTSSSKPLVDGRTTHEHTHHPKPPRFRAIREPPLTCIDTPASSCQGMFGKHLTTFQSSTWFANIACLQCLCWPMATKLCSYAFLDWWKPSILTSVWNPKPLKETSSWTHHVIFGDSMFNVFAVPSSKLRLVANMAIQCKTLACVFSSISYRTNVDVWLHLFYIPLSILSHLCRWTTA